MFGFLIVPIKHKHADIRNYISLESAKQNWKKALDFEARCNHGSDPSFYPENLKETLSREPEFSHDYVIVGDTTFIWLGELKLEK
jgi:hypothetical protein